MDRPDSHVIDKNAQLLFEGCIPTWTVSKLDPDYFKDYLVEPALNGVLTGESLIVQLKGQRKVRVSRNTNSISFSIKTKHAEYWLDKRKDIPVFLVVVDTSERMVWWLFMQEALSIDQSWRTKEKCTVRIPLANDLRQSDRFLIAVRSAIAWMKRTNPGTIQDALERRRKEIQQLDDRFKVAVSADGAGVHCDLTVTREVKLQLKGAGDPGVRQKFENLVERGSVVSFARGELAITGSRIFDGVEQCEVTMRIGSDRKYEISLVTYDGLDRESMRFDSLAGVVTGGTKYWKLEAALESSPFKIVVEMVDEMHVHVAFQHHFDLWEQQRFSELSWFEQVWRISKALAEATRSCIEVRQKGNRITQFSIDHSELKADLIETSQQLEIIRKARRIFELAAMAEVRWISARVSTCALNRIGDLYDLVETGACFSPGKSCDMSIVVGNEGVSQFKRSALGSVRTNQVEAFDVFGEELFLIVEHSCSSMRVAAQATVENGVRFKVVGVDGSVWKRTFRGFVPKIRQMVAQPKPPN